MEKQGTNFLIGGTILINRINPAHFILPVTLTGAEFSFRSSKAGSTVFCRNVTPVISSLKHSYCLLSLFIAMLVIINQTDIPVK